MDVKSIEAMLFDDDVKKSILYAMDRVLETEPYDKVKVSRICEEANVSRATFYRHFRNVDEALDWYMARSVRVGIGNIGRTLEWLEGLEVSMCCALILRNAVEALRISNPTSRSKHDEMFDETCYRALVETLVFYRREKLTERLEYLIRSWAMSVVYGLAYWFENNLSMSVATMATWLEATVPTELHDLLDGPLENTVQPSGE